MTTPLKTSADILNERNRERANGRLAHTPNGYGEFYARPGCTCYTCRDCLDPTGEADATLYNVALLATVTPPTATPPAATLPAPSVTRRDVICFCCVANDDSEEVESTAEIPVVAVPGPHRLCLPRPSCLARHPSLGSPTSVMSSLVGVVTPSSASPSLEEVTRTMETDLKPYLHELLQTYQQLRGHVEQRMNDPSLRHDEMAAYDAWWTQADAKVNAVESLLAEMHM